MANVRERRADAMILRRIAAALRRQDWLTVAIEFVIVVAGIFVGLQVQEWANERGERKLERQYLERILADIDLSIETTEGIREFVMGYAKGQELVVDTLRRCELRDDQKNAFADGISDLGKVGPSVFVLSTMEEMLSAGHFSLIKNPDIRDVLNGLKRDALYQAEIRTALFNHIESMSAQTAMRTIRIYKDYKDPFAPVLWEDFDIDFAALCEDRGFQALVSHIRALTDNMRSLNDRALAKLRPAKAVLEAELHGAPNADKETS